MASNSVIEQYGFKIYNEGANKFRIERNSTYKAPEIIFDGADIEMLERFWNLLGQMPLRMLWCELLSNCTITLQQRARVF